MNDKSHVNVELAIPGYKHNPALKSPKLNRAFQDAMKVTRSYTLMRDVQDLVDTALQREKRNG